MPDPFVIDAHLDLAFNAVGNGADLTLPIEQLRQTDFGRAMAAKRETPTVSLPALRAGNVAVAVATIFVPSRGSVFNMTGPSYGTPQEAYELGRQQLAYYHGLADRGEVTLVRDRVELDAALTRRTPGLLLAMEGADPVREVAELGQWVEDGLRMIGPAWGRTRFGGGTGAPGPLTDLGRDLLDEMGRLGVGLDLAHQSDEGFWEALERFEGPLCVSHANCQALVPGDRQLSDNMIKAVAERDGVIGMVLYNKYLRPGYDLATDPPVPMSDIVRHIEHVCNVVGDTRHVGIGSDLDGGLGVEWTPEGLDNAADLPKVGEALRDAGWGASDVAAVLGQNWARWLSEQLLSPGQAA